MTEQPKPNTTGWETAYNSTDQMWGEDADLRLLPYLKDLQRGPALDLGLGEGANAVWLANTGFAVEGIDISPTAIERALERATKAGVGLKAEAADICQYSIAPGKYNLINCDMVLMFLDPSNAHTVSGKMIAGLAPGGILKVSVFSVEDPMHAKLASSSRKIGNRTYWHPKLECPVHFFTVAEIEEWYGSLEMLSISNERLLDTSHDAPHYHGVIVYIGRKK